MTRPSDPLYSLQWHFNLIGNIETIWDEFNGAAITVGVYDEGVDYNHEDLVANYDSSLHVVDSFGNAVDPSPITGGNGHGTACAGIIGAANNGIGGVGVACGVTLTGVNIDFDNMGTYGSINAADLTPFLDVVGQAINNFDVTSNSWGSYPGYYAALLDGGFATMVNGVYGALVDQGRNGLGTNIVQAAGNDDEDANGAGLNASRFTITVAATESTGIAAWYSNFGACILVAAPAAAYTTDMTGSDGYSDDNYTGSFNGTSAATPVVSGVIALMLQANTGLGWRDVQNILASSASLTGSAFGDSSAESTEDGIWQANGNTNWNGGGNHVHTNYGYGMVNAFNAVRMAEVWDLFAVAKTSSNELVATSGLNDFADTVVPDGSSVGFTTTFTISTNIVIEHVSLTLDFKTTYVGDLRIVLTSADGTQIVVTQGSLIGTDVDAGWTFGIDSLRGELSAGVWTMQVYDIAAADILTVTSASLDIYGSAATVNDVYHFTDEYMAMIGFDGTRRAISDTDGGVDWLNMAAMTGNIVVKMTSGQSFSVNGVVAGTLTGNFENIVTGDGADLITGTAGRNEIHGMRGNDTLNGGAASDTLVGGMGNDTYITDGGDTIIEDQNAGTDTVLASATTTLQPNLEKLTLTGTAAINGTGNAANNVITGNNGKNILDGNKGADTLIGGLGDDTYITDGGDTITEAAASGTDTVYASATHSLAANLENVILTGSLAINGTGNAANNAITGNSAANTLSGGAGNDTLTGGAGRDFYLGGSGSDSFVFNTAADSGITEAGSDVITDFLQGQDKIRLNAMDAFTNSAANDTFLWTGTASAFGNATSGEVRYQKFDNTGTANDYTMIWIDNDADSSVEMAIRLTGLFTLAASDFVL